MPTTSIASVSMIMTIALSAKTKSWARKTIAWYVARFAALKGDRKGQYSIRINDQWRVCFRWPEKSPGPLNVEIVDYH
jgi:plasmid maintenance system killer protein